MGNNRIASIRIKIKNRCKNKINRIICISKSIANIFQSKSRATKFNRGKKKEWWNGFQINDGKRKWKKEKAAINDSKNRGAYINYE